MTIDESVLKAHIRDIPDWPSPGVLFRDITPLVNDVSAYRAVIETFVARFRTSGIDRIVGVEARGFLFGAPVAYELGAGFVPVRKPGKLPWQIEREEYALEYGTDALEIHVDAIHPGERIVVLDDVLATGGTAGATVRLARRLGAEVVAAAFVVEIGFLDGRRALDLPPDAIVALASYS